MAQYIVLCGLFSCLKGIFLLVTHKWFSIVIKKKTQKKTTAMYIWLESEVSSSDTGINAVSCNMHI